MLISVLIGIALPLIHPYTWNVEIAILVAYFAWALLKRRSCSELYILFFGASLGFLCV